MIKFPGFLRAVSPNVRKGFKSLNLLGVQLRSVGVTECTTRAEMIKMNSPALIGIYKKKRYELDRELK